MFPSVAWMSVLQYASALLFQCTLTVSEIHDCIVQSYYVYIVVLLWYD